MKLKPVHHEAILLFAASESNISIAKKLKVTPETVSVWKNDYAIQAELNKLLEANNKAAGEKMRSLSIIALETIEQVMVDTEQPAKDRLNAALKVLELNRVRQNQIGATNASILQKEAQQDELLNNYGL